MTNERGANEGLRGLVGGLREHIRALRSGSAEETLDRLEAALLTRRAETPVCTCSPGPYCAIHNPPAAPPAENDCTGSQDCKHTCPDIAAIEQAAFEKAALQVQHCPGETVEGVRWIEPKDAVARIRSLAAGRKEGGR